MASIKTFTSLEQSKKLAEILPLESADMFYWEWKRDTKNISIANVGTADESDLPCWSLAALLNYLREIDFFPNIESDEHSVIMSISYYDEKEARPLAPIHSIKVETDTFVDACYEMILKLHELKML